MLDEKTKKEIENIFSKEYLDEAFRKREISLEEMNKSFAKWYGITQETTDEELERLRNVCYE